MNDRLTSQLLQLLNEDISSAIEREQYSFDKAVDSYNKSFILFGAGSIGRNALNILRSQGIEPMAFSDNNPKIWGKKIDGINVLSPYDAAQKFGSDSAFIVTIFNRECNFISIRKQLTELSCKKVVPFSLLFWKYPKDYLPHMLLDLPHKILKHKDQVLEAFNLFEDNISRKEYLSQLRWRLLSDFSVFTKPDNHEQYFPDDIFTLKTNEVFIDCGAYDGDTIRSIINHQIDYDSIIAFEPDPINFKHLQDYLSTLPDLISKKISAQLLAVSASRGTVNFTANGTLGSKLSENGNITVECDTLDNLLKRSNPTYIKMDIEGAELDALNGAVDIIHKSNTTWAVCVYHKIEDLWQIPIYINQHSKTSGKYKFFLRKYIGEMYEMVCYAVPKHRLKV